MQSAACKLKLAGDLSVDLGRFYVRDMPLPFDILVENIHDQSHVPFAHHGVASSR